MKIYAISNSIENNRNVIARKNATVNFKEKFPLKKRTEEICELYNHVDNYTENKISKKQFLKELSNDIKKIYSDEKSSKSLTKIEQRYISDMQTTFELFCNADSISDIYLKDMINFLKNK